MKRRLRPDASCAALLLAILCASCTGEQATPETGPGPDAVAGDPDGDPGPIPDAPGDIIGPHADAPGNDATEPGSDMDAPDPGAPLAIPYVTPPWDEPHVDAQFLQEDNSNPLLDAGFAPLIALAAPGPSDDAPRRIAPRGLVVPTPDGGDAPDFANTIRWLKLAPTDGIRWTLNNLQRNDLALPPEYYRVSGQQRRARSDGRILPADERPNIRHNTSQYEVEGGWGSNVEIDGADIVAAYWMARFHGFVVPGTD